MTVDSYNRLEIDRNSVMAEMKYKLVTSYTTFWECFLGVSFEVKSLVLL